MTVGVSSPAILNMLGIMRSSPCEAVKVVAKAPFCRAPCRTPAAPASDCISMTSGTAPQRLGLPAAAQSSASLPHGGGRRDRVDGDDLAERIGDTRSCLVAVEAQPVLIHEVPLFAGRRPNPVLSGVNYPPLLYQGRGSVAVRLTLGPSASARARPVSHCGDQECLFVRPSERQRPAMAWPKAALSAASEAQKTTRRILERGCSTR